MIRPIECRHAPIAETSSGLAFAFAAAHIEVEVARPHADQFGFVLFRDRQDERHPHAACHGGRAQRRALAAHLLRGICPRFVGRRVLRIQLCAFDTMGGLSVQQLPKRDVCGGRDQRASDRSAIEPRLATHCRPRWSWIACRVCHVNALWRLGLSAVIEDTSGRKSYWALAHPPGKPDFHHADCFAHEFSPVVQP